MTVGEVIAAVAEQRSAWHRFDVLQAICDVARPQPAVDGAQWARMLHEVTDTVLAECVDLDPDDTEHSSTGFGWAVGVDRTIGPSSHQQRRVRPGGTHHLLGDGRTTRPTCTVHHRGHGSARCDAGRGRRSGGGADRLVLVVGPAGAGKTTMLAAAVDDLTTQGRVVFGVAPTAKAARVLESETGMGSDTVAKLLHEWRRTDRPPERPWRLPVGATVIVDEAGMINTGDLHQLTHLADAQQWRLVLVGDPHQLQAVGPWRHVRRTLRDRPDDRARHDPPLPQPVGSGRVIEAATRRPQRPRRLPGS